MCYIHIYVLGKFFYPNHHTLFCKSHFLSNVVEIIIISFIVFFFNDKVKKESKRSCMCHKFEECTMYDLPQLYFKTMHKNKVLQKSFLHC